MPEGGSSEGVVEVAGDLAGRFQRRFELHPPGQRERFGQEVPLDVAGDGHLAGEALGVAQAALVQRGAQACAQHGGPELGREIVVGARLEAPLEGAEVVHHRHHDDRNAREFGVAAERLHEPRGVRPGQLRVQQHQVERPGPELPEGLAPLAGRVHGVPLPLHVTAEALAIGGVMGDDQHAHRSVVGRGRSRWWWGGHRKPLTSR